MTPNFVQHKLPYQATGRFTKIVLDYLSRSKELQPFYKYDTTLTDVQKAIENKQRHPINRSLLVSELTRQYAGVTGSEKVLQNIRLLSNKNTFTVCTAHQPNIFTGHFYFIHKIIHVIRLADELAQRLPEYRFVPVFFMGSEDADLEELNHIQFGGKKYRWNTNQTGAVGRMFVDDDLTELILQIEGRLLTEPHGQEVCSLLRDTFRKGTTIQQATFQFVHALFKQFGLIVFLPDGAAFKKEMISVFEDDIFRNIPAKIVKETSEKLSGHHHAQAFARNINLFYMKDDIRSRIVEVEGSFVVHDTGIAFTKAQLQNELQEHPERFSPNVILRGLFQEKFLPDIAFIGGGGELAYWLQLKDLFRHYEVPYPVLFLRNSFLIIEKNYNKLREKLSINIEDLFTPEEQLLQQLVKRDSEHSLSLHSEKEALENLFEMVSQKAGVIDTTLIDHVTSLKSKGIKKLIRVEKKMISAEKKKQDATTRQLHKLLNALFPNDGLQERTDNFMLLYARWGAALFDEIYRTSPTFEPAFTVIEEEDGIM